MSKTGIAILLMLCGVAWGQKTITCAGSSDGHCIPVNPPITIQGADNYSNQTLLNFVTKPGCDATVGKSNIIVTPAHTEREWQELVERIKVLESEKARATAYKRAGLQSTRIALQCLHDLGVCTDRIDNTRNQIQELQEFIRKAQKP